MRTKNRFELRGFVGQNPQVKTLESGKKVVNLSIATNEVYTDKNGEKKTVTDWFSITLWGNLATIAQKYAPKGSLVYVEGRIKPRTYENKEGEKTFTTDFIADQIDIILNKEEEKE